MSSRHAAEIEANPVPIGFAEPDRGHDKNDRAEPAQHCEDGAPIEPLGEIGAEGRRYRRRQGHYHHDDGEPARRRFALVDVADDRSAEHDAGAGAERLQDAAGDQRRQ